MNSGDCSLCIASENGHLDIVRFLVEKGADINYIGYALCFNDYARPLR